MNYAFHIQLNAGVEIWRGARKCDRNSPVCFPSGPWICEIFLRARRIPGATPALAFQRRLIEYTLSKWNFSSRSFGGNSFHQYFRTIPAHLLPPHMCSLFSCSIFNFFLYEARCLSFEIRYFLFSPVYFNRIILSGGILARILE